MKTLEKRQRLARCSIELSVCYVFHGVRTCLNTNMPPLRAEAAAKHNFLLTYMVIKGKLCIKMRKKAAVVMAVKGQMRRIL